MHLCVAAQTENEIQGIENNIENISESVDYTTLTDQYDYYRKNPISINSATTEELASLHILSPLQIEALFEHIRTAGKLTDLYELQSIEYFDVSTVQQLLPFITLKEDENIERLKRISFLGNNQFITRIQRITEQQKGYAPDGDYVGDPLKIYSRYSYNFKNILSANITAERDAGEAFFTRNNKQGFDFYSAHLAISNIRSIKKIVVGDYEAQFGQGLAFYNGLGFGKSSEVLNISKNAQGIRPFRSANEALFLRGAATTLQFKKIQVTVFGSYQKINAAVRTVSDSTAVDNFVIQSTDLSGFYRTPAEIAKKNTLLQQIVGANAQYQLKKFKVGITGANILFPKQNNTHVDFFETGSPNSQIVAAIDYTLNMGNMYAFGELAYTTQAVAVLNGIVAGLSPKLSISLLHRYFDKNYNALYTNAFAESSKPKNENGLYTGISISPNKRWKWNTYVDVFSFPAPKYLADAPSKGTDILTQVNYAPSRTVNMYARFRNQRKQQNSSGSDVIDYLINNNRDSYRFHIEYKVSDALSMRSRAEVVNFKKEFAKTETGAMLYQDISYKVPFIDVTLDARYALFDVQSYNARIYAFEKDVLYAYSISLLQDEGVRWYILARKTITNGIDVWIRYARFTYADKTTIGNGNELIDGNTRSEVKVQLRLLF